MATQNIDGFEIRTDLVYDVGAHLWMNVTQDGIISVGVDPLGIETFGTLAQIALEAPPINLERGMHFGSMEAEKFVGTLVSPIAGLLTERNEVVMADPGIVERDPYGDGWLIKIKMSTDPTTLPYLTSGADAVIEAFEKRVAAYRLEGVLAE
ncbi:MAG: hypothetical protein QGD89_03280 [Actinomycetota bacterium]|nr:hypothetical protein [Actinomycetota bacterium]